MHWKDFPINNRILKSLKEQKLVKPLPIQIKAFKATLIQNKHVLGAAQTGSGKTLAYAIPILNQILDNGPISSNLRRKIGTHHEKEEDFELIEGELFSVEDMIVDKPVGLQDSGEQSFSDGKLNRFHERLCPEAIILVPTRELAIQVKEEFDKLTNHTDIKTCCIIGGINLDKQLKVLNRSRPQVVVATPGRLYEIVNTDSIAYLNVQSVASIRTLVIDEADRMVQKGHFEELLKIIDIIKESEPHRNSENAYRVYLFSATLTFLHELPDRFKPGSLKNQKNNPKNKSIIDPRAHTKKNKIKRLLTLFGITKSDTRVIDLNDQTNHGKPSSNQLKEYKISCLAREKDLYLYYFLLEHTNTRCLIFCNSKDCLRRLSNVLKFFGYDVLRLHSEMDQKKRLSSLERFRVNSCSILVATDVAARGLDIKELDCVIHYQVPRTCETYIHRSGRTARVDRKGISLTLCEPKEVHYYRKFCNAVNNGEDLDMYDVDVDLLNLLKDRVQLAQECDKLDHKLRESKSNQNWFTKAAKECDIELDDDYVSQLCSKGKTKQQNQEDESRNRRRLNQLQKQLKAIMNRPLVTRGYIIRQSAEKIDKSIH